MEKITIPPVEDSRSAMVATAIILVITGSAFVGSVFMLSGPIALLVFGGILMILAVDIFLYLSVSFSIQERMDETDRSSKIIGPPTPFC